MKKIELGIESALGLPSDNSTDCVGSCIIELRLVNSATRLEVTFNLAKTLSFTENLDGVGVRKLQARLLVVISLEIKAEPFP